MLFVIRIIADVPMDITKFSFTGSGSSDLSGRTGLVRRDGGTFHVGIVGAGGVNVCVHENGEKNVEGFTILPPQESTFSVNVYDSTSSDMPSKGAKMAFASNGACSLKQVGEFRILELSYSADGSVATLAVDFFIKEVDGDPKKWVRGSFRYHSAIDVSVLPKK